MEPDHLALWRVVRAGVAWADIVPHLQGPVHAVRDGFASFVDGTSGRGQARRDRLRAAYDDVRFEAAHGSDLSAPLLARWNGITRGLPPAGFRRSTAYAKGGRERYGTGPDTERDFDRCLTDIDAPHIPVTARAARVYLDVLFFHPHDDANARLAALALAFVLLRGGVELDQVEPILMPARRADDAEGAADLVRLVHGIACATQRRRLRSIA